MIWDVPDPQMWPYCQKQSPRNSGVQLIRVNIWRQWCGAFLACL